MWRIVRFVALVLVFAPRGAQAQDLPAALSDRAQISLVTCSPGQELYSTFGHSALRVQDPATGLDVAFNWGTFDFSTENFYLKFMRGHLLYRLSISPFDWFMEDYVRQKRGVTEQVLALTTDQRSALYAAMRENARPENRDYLYDFYFDNCATRIRDLLEDALGDDMAYRFPPPDDKTFRDYLDEYVDHLVWVDLGFDLILGINSHRHADHRASMFLPDYLMDHLGDATVDGRPLVGSSTVLLPWPTDPPARPPLFLRPVTLAWILFVLLLLPAGIELRRGRPFPGIDATLFTIVGLLGALFLVMWVATAHHSTYANLNMFWAVPLLFLVVPLLRRVIGRRAWVMLAVLAMVPILGWFILPQSFHPAVAPLIGVLVTRYVVGWFTRSDGRASASASAP